MKFTCDKNTILREVSLAQDIISSKNTLSILSNILLESENNRLVIKASDLKVHLETLIPVDTKEAGTTTVYCDKFLNILRTLPEGEVEFNQTKEQTFFIKPLFKKIDFQLKTVSSDKYPEITDIEESAYFQISQKDFLEMINQTIFAISDDESRYFMNGVYMEKVQNKIVMVSTDGRRLSFIERAVDDTIRFEQGIIIPPKVLNLVRKMATGEGNVHIAVTDKHIYIKFNNQKLISTLIEGQFPNYKRVIPEKHTHTIMVKKSELAEALKRVSLLVEQKSKRIFMTINSDTITLNSEESDIGKAAEDIACTYDGESAVIALNYQYLADPLKVIHGDEVKIGFTDPNKAITLSEKDEESCFHIVMPMQS